MVLYKCWVSKKIKLEHKMSFDLLKKMSKYIFLQVSWLFSANTQNRRKVSYEHLVPPERVMTPRNSSVESQASGLWLAYAWQLQRWHGEAWGGKGTGKTLYTGKPREDSDPRYMLDLDLHFGGISRRVPICLQTGDSCSPEGSEAWRSECKGREKWVFRNLLQYVLDSITL